MKSFKLFLLASLVILFSSALQGSDIDCEDNNRTEQGAGIIIDGICVDPPELPYLDRPDCGDDMKLLQGNDNNCTNGSEVPAPGPYPPVPSTPCPAGKYTDQGTGECTLDIASTTEPLPADITIDNSALLNFIVSTYDNTQSYSKYLTIDNTPYNQAIDIQGVIDAHGMTLSVPYTVTGSSVILSARTTSVTLDASVTENDEAGIVMTFAWNGQMLPVGSGTFTATITIDDRAGNNDGVYYAKKLDTATTEGLVVAIFPYTINNASDKGYMTLKIAPAILDRMFGVADNSGNVETHKFLYTPVVNPTTGKTWLSNNLGANYANMHHPDYNITKQATASDDYNAYGSLFQWGRQGDGHELIVWISGSEGIGGSISYTRDTSIPPAPTHSKFIAFQYNPFDWTIYPDNSLWSEEYSNNNVCPRGYRVPTITELLQEKNSWTRSNAEGALSSILALPMSGYRHARYATIEYEGLKGQYWSSTPHVTSFNIKYSKYIYFDSNQLDNSYYQRQTGLPVRCIKD